MVIGRLTKMAIFYAKNETSDEYGQKVANWQKAFSILGGTTDIKARERLISERQLRHHMTKLYIRYDDRIDTKMRVNINKFWYEITGYALIDNERALELVLEEIEMNDNYNG